METVVNKASEGPRFGRGAARAGNLNHSLEAPRFARPSPDHHPPSRRFAPHQSVTVVVMKRAPWPPTRSTPSSA
ncbi:hypothetical protein SAM23877_2554 [Streptomyces ambofaciens ATCC 23877]|uniref:Uncharacterized protein n=1 Tax=Streptomyces ambofaciens (strain ATCC 23877 / 3486 / DSM 40053 / JCM 4204 / NBRC 12836 / NRRL B-2516) TaxID=278992 RepID=A0A0K2ARI2_STRA7|nr:hypothetical protein SAM23877_2554 [Streptomyces ambofaciens ATCC 23877]